MNLQVSLIFLLVSTQNTLSARILAAIFVPSYSHHLPFRPLWEELAKRGHEIVLLTANPSKDLTVRNIRQIDLSESYLVQENFGSAELVAKGESRGAGMLFNEWHVLDALDAAIDWQLGQPEVKALVQNSSEQFDLLIVEAMNPTYMAFAERFKIPFIGVTPSDPPYQLYSVMGNQKHPVLYPNCLLHHIYPLTFPQRVMSVAFDWMVWAFERYIRYPTATKMARKHFGDDLRDLSEVEKDMSMLFINVNPFFQQLRPLGSNTLVIGGGTHIVDRKPLPEDLLLYLDNSKEDVIYFSLGTTVKTFLLDNSTLNIIKQTFADLPYKIIWKVDEEIGNLSDNVKLMRWVPQQDLLAHPKVTLFITQCGTMSIEEAIHFHVPIVGMPFMWDQFSNAETAISKGIGLVVDKSQLTVKDFEDTIKEVIENPRFKQNMIALANLTKDVEKTGLERAVWWTEYVIRTKGAKHLRSPARDIPLYQYFLLDVLGFCWLILVLSILAIAGLLKLVRRIFMWEYKTKEKCD